MKNEKGITLIALVITIIVMLILVTVTIRVATEGNLFTHAANAAKSTNAHIQNETAILNDDLGIEEIVAAQMGGETLSPKTQIPAGGVYLRMTDMTSYYSEITNTEKAIVAAMFNSYGYPGVTIDNFPKAGEMPPEGRETMDIYLYGDYVYVYNFNPGDDVIEGWTAKVWDRTKTGYGEILYRINGENLTNLQGTFYNCQSLTTAPKIPGGVTNLVAIFQDCTSLTSITIPSGVTSIGDYAFQNCTSLTSITIPSGVTSIGDSAFSDCTSLTSITIPSGVTSIGDYAFQNCTSLTSITIPSSVTSIGDSAFSDCTSLTSITIPSGVTSIGNLVFFSCTSLTSITIPSGVTSVGTCAFKGCTSLTSASIPSGVTSIGTESFASCLNLTSITMPSSVTSIGVSALQNCTSLTSITYEGTKSEWNSIDLRSGWAYNSPITTIHCTDGDIAL